MNTTSFKISQELLKNNLKAEPDKFWIQFNDKSEPELRSFLTVKEEFSVEKIVAAYDLETILNALPKKHPFCYKRRILVLRA